jgi:hypothetical protein
VPGVSDICQIDGNLGQIWCICPWLDGDILEKEIKISYLLFTIMHKSTATWPYG